MRSPSASPVALSAKSRRACSKQANQADSPTTLLHKSGRNKAGVANRRTYVTATRLAVLRQQLKPRQWALLSDVGRLNLASGEQLRRLHYADSLSGQRLARLDLKDLVDKRVLTRLGRTIGGRRAGSEGWTFALGVAGQRLLRPDQRRHREPWTPDTSHLRHALAVSELYVQLRTLETGGQTQLEMFDTEPRCWRFFRGPGGSPVTLKPDAFVVSGNDDYLDSWFVELDRGTESRTRILAKAKLYWRYFQSGREQSGTGVFPSVVFTVLTDQRRAQLVDTLKRLETDQRQLFQVVTADRAAVAMTSDELLNDSPREATA